MQWEVEPTGARIAQLATDLTARIDALDPESDTPVYSDFTFSIAVADWTLANGVYTARVNNTVLLTENAGIQVFYDASLRTGLTGDIFADKHTGYVIFTTTLQPVGPISGIIRVLNSVSGMLSVAKGGTGAATPKKARENLNTPIRDISVDFGTVSSLPQTFYDADITANMVAFDAVFGNPAAVPDGIDATFAAGSVTISGTMVSGQETTISFLCHEKRTAVEGTESESAEPRVNEFVHVGAQTLTADQQTQVRANLGAASASDVATLNSKIVYTEGAINLSSHTAKTLIDSVVANGQKIYYCSASGGNKLSDLPITQAGVYIVRADTYYKSLDFMGTNGYDYHYDYTNNSWTSLNSKTEFEPGESYDASGLFGTTKANSAGTSAQIIIDMPRGVRSTLQITHNLTVSACRKYDGTNVTEATVSSVVRLDWKHLGVNISGSFSPHNMYFIQLSGSISFS